MNAFQLLKYASVLIIAIYVICIILLFLFQKKLIFFPEKLSADFRFSLRSGDRELTIRTKDGERINGLFFQGAGDNVILYFHGNAGSLSGWQHVAPDFMRHGFNVLIVDFRGYGKSTGAISENGFYLDAEAAYETLLKDYGPENIIIYGRSIGTGVATYLASRRPCQGVILESPYSSLTQLANEKLPLAFPGVFLTTRFNSIARISAIKAPIILIHGAQDELIPMEHSERLFAKITAPKKMFILPNGSHNDLNAFDEFHHIIAVTVPQFFSKKM